MFKLPDLPYDYAALEPVISQATMHLHHDKHHKRYFDVTNQIVEEQGLSGSLEDLVRGAAGKAESRKLFNNAAQAWNHAFFWDGLSPTKTAPRADLAAAIDATFGGLDALKEKFVAEGVGHFGSGWVWLVSDASGALKVISTHDAESPVTEGLTALVVADVWEHAYYLDYQNLRKGFLEAVFDNLINWTLADSQYAAAKSGAQGWAYPAPA